MPYSTVLLDLDHTLFDTDQSEAAAFTQTLKRAGIADPDSYVDGYRTINLSLWAAVERGEISPQQVKTRRFELLVAEAELDADAQEMAESFVNGLGEHGELYHDAKAVLESLSERASLALVTNGLSEVQRTRIDRLGIGEYFDTVVISAEVGVAKPHTEIFDIVFAGLDQPEKSTTLMVGDSLSSDIQGGTNFGISTCWFNPSRKSAASIDQVDYEIDKLTALTDVVDGHRRSG